jgi:hypothetical protein
VHEVVITCGSDVIARHERSYEREAVVFDPLHYLALIEQKTRALNQAAPLANSQLPECFATLRRLLEARLKKHGSREYVQVLRLMETFTIAEVTHAVEDALHLGTISFDAVKHLLLCRIGRAPLNVDRQAVLHDRGRGMSLTDIATAYRPSRASVSRIIKKARETTGPKGCDPASPQTHVNRPPIKVKKGVGCDH